MIRVVLVDDQAMLRHAFALILSVEDDIEVVGQCRNGAEAVALVSEVACDIVLMDIEMPVMDGLEAARRIRMANGPQVLILTTFDRDDYLFEALAAGSAGFMLKNAEPEKLLESIRTVASGGALLAPEVTRRVIAQAVDGRESTPPRSDQIRQLTAREREILVLMTKGLSNTEIAERLFVSETTVKSHVSACLAKLGARNRVQAVIHAFEHGLGQTP